MHSENYSDQAFRRHDVTKSSELSPKVAKFVANLATPTEKKSFPVSTENWTMVLSQYR